MAKKSDKRYQDRIERLRNQLETVVTDHAKEMGTVSDVYRALNAAFEMLLAAETCIRGEQISNQLLNLLDNATENIGKIAPRAHTGFDSRYFKEVK